MRSILFAMVVALSLATSFAAKAQATGAWFNYGIMNQGCNTAVRLNDGQVLVIAYDGQSCWIFNPDTYMCGKISPLSQPREYPSIAVLPNGNVLVAGGSGNSGTLSSCELYNPETGMWTATGDMLQARIGHTVTPLANGKVLAAGGESDLSSCELYDPATGLWTPTGDMTQGRQSNNATLLLDGKVLVTGGRTAELYDPKAGVWAATDAMPVDADTATLLQDGRVLVTGDGGCALYAPKTGKWTTTGEMAQARPQAKATRLDNGKVLVVGGYGGSCYLSSCELYDPSTEKWSVTGSTAQGWYDHTVVLLANGKVLVAGGYSSGGGYSSTYELYDPETGKWEAHNMAQRRSGHTANLLANGKILVAGGGSASCELYAPSSATWAATGSMAEARYGHTATQLPDGKILVAGGGSASCELYAPSSATWTTTGSMATARWSGHTATLLPNGKILVAGGYFYNGSAATSTYLSSCELYDPTTGTWTAISSMAEARSGHTATLLADGKILVAGGRHAGTTFLSSCELYNPETGTWMVTGSMADAREGHTATRLQNNKVLVTGGWNPSRSTALSSCELYDPGTGAWTATGDMSRGRETHTATLLPDNQVLVTGGYGSEAELFNVGTEAWVEAGEMAQSRSDSTATLLPDGKVFVAGGGPATCELYDPSAFYVNFVSSSSLMGSIGGVTAQVLLPGGSTSAVFAAPTTGYKFVNWTGDYSGTENPLTLKNVSKDMTVTANFAEDKSSYTVTFLAGAHGSLSGETSQTVAAGGDCSAVSAKADSGYHFSGWTGGVTSTANPLTITKVNSDMTITANFTAGGVSFQVAPGSVFNVSAADAGVESFTKKPKVAAGGASAKVLSFKAGATSLKCQWTSVKTAPGTYSLTVGETKVTDNFVVATPTVATVSPNTGAAGTKVTVTGTWFGSKKPKAYMAFIDAKGKTKYSNCKLDKPSYADAAGKAGKSYMDVGTGASKLVFAVPKGVETTTEATLTLEFGWVDEPVEEPFNAAE